MIGSNKMSVRFSKAQLDPDAGQRMEKNKGASPYFRLYIHGARSVPKGKDFDPNVSPVTQKFMASSLDEAQQWADAIQAAAEASAHEAMSTATAEGGAALSARAVKLLVIEGGTSGKDGASEVSCCCSSCCLRPPLITMFVLAID